MPCPKLQVFGCHLFNQNHMNMENQKFRRFSSFSAKIKNLAEHKSAYLFKFLELEPEIEI